MMVTKNIDLKLWEKNCITLYAIQGEVDARYIRMSFKNQDLTSLNLTDKSVTIYAQKPDSTQIFNNCIIDLTDNTVMVKLTSQFLSSAGIVECEFQIFEGNSVLLKVSGLRIVVCPTEDFSETVKSASEYNALIDALNKAQNFADSSGNLENLTTNNKSSIISAINELNQKTIPLSQGGTGGISSNEARKNLEVFKAYILYNNDSGNEGTVALNDNTENYEFIDIITWDFYISRVYSQNNRPVGIMKVGGYGWEYFEWYSETLIMTGNTITRNGVTNGKISPDGSIQINTMNHLPIHSVIGYKF